MVENRTERLNLRLTPYEMELIVRHAKKVGMTPSEYGRVAVLFDMVLSGNPEVIKYVASQVTGKMGLMLREKLEPLFKGFAVGVKG